MRDLRVKRRIAAVFIPTERKLPLLGSLCVREREREREREILNGSTANREKKSEVYNRLWSRRRLWLRFLHCLPFI